MPLEIRLFREDASFAQVLASEAKRFSGEEGSNRCHLIKELDEKWRVSAKDVDLCKKEKNLVSKLVGQKKKAKEDASVEQEQAKSLSLKILALEKESVNLRAEIDRLLPMVGNIVHDSVVVSNDEEKDNDIVRTYGEAASPDNIVAHNQLLWRIGGYEPERGVKVSGHRGYFLKGPGVLLNQALIAYSTAFLGSRDYTPLQPPYFMKKSVMASVAQLSDFDESLYHVGQVSSTRDEEESSQVAAAAGGKKSQPKGDTSGDDKYLIATSEQPICAYHMGDWFRSSEELPIKYAGVSTCFRKEAGKAGKDTWGIFRVHQFDKVEQFVITEPSKSWEAHEEMRKIAEAFLESLGLPYRTVNIVSGELNLAASKKYDIEAWFPKQGEYKELVSCSNCTDFQARAVDIRFGGAREKNSAIEYVHMLNSTLCALTRTISCILENYQTEDGVKIPEVLVPFMGGKTFLPFLREEMVFDQKKAAKKN